MCDADSNDNSIISLDETNQFYLHLFSHVPRKKATVFPYVAFYDNEHHLSFSYKNCTDFDSSTEADLYGICDQTFPFSLKILEWSKLHVTIQKSANVGESGAVRPNDYCPYDKDVHCIILEIQDSASVLRLSQPWFFSLGGASLTEERFYAIYASVNCISGKVK